MAKLSSTTIYGNLNVSLDTLIGGILSTTDTTASTSKTTGAMTIAGGLGVAGDIWSTKYNDLTLTKQTTGFTIAGGATSKTLTVNGDATVSGTNTGNQTITSGNGMNFTSGSGSVTITLGGPSTITSSSTNSVTATSHTHAIDGEALTKTDDTNVTLTLGGTPTTGMVKATSLTLGWTGQLGVGRGGTGIGSYAIGDILYASGASVLSKLADVATGNALISGGVGVAPSYGKVGLTTHITGTLAIGNGGTGTATAPTRWGIIYASTTSAYASTGAGTSGQYLKSNATSAPTWASFATATFTVTSNRANVANKTFVADTSSTIYIYEPNQDLETTSNPTFAALTVTSINKVTITTPTTSATLTIADGKTLTTNNSITLTASNDTSTLNIGTGGTLASGAFAAAYSLPTATSLVLGGVKPDGTTITNTSGAISVTYGTTASTACQGNDSRLSDAYTHITSDGSSHSFINQSVTTSASPSFAGCTLIGGLNGTSATFTGQVQAGSFNATSRRALKDNIIPYVDNAIEKLNQIAVVSYTLKADIGKEPHVGFIADDTDSIFSGPNKDHMDVGNTLGILIKAVQELSNKYQELQEKMSEL